MKRASRPRTAIIGTGRLARAIGPLLPASGYVVVTVAGRRIAPARSLCRKIPGARAMTSHARAARDAGLILLAVPDREIAPLASDLSENYETWQGKIVLHHAGSLGLEPLRALQRAGAEVGLLHPLQALGDASLGSELLAGSRARVEGTSAAAAAARRLARDLGLVPLHFPRRLNDRDRIAYHAAASLASNDLVALLGAAVDLLQTTGLGRRAAVEALVPLARGTLEQAGRRGLGAALSGPVVRGDASTVAAQLRVLDRVSRRDARIHRWLSRRLLTLAEDEGQGLPPAGRRRLRRVLSDADGSGGRGGKRTV